MKPFDLKWGLIVNWLMGTSKPPIEKNIESLMIYKVSLNTTGQHQKVNVNKPSAILKRCEGARGILYMNETKAHSFLPYSVLKRTRIIEIKDVSMKIRIHEDEVMNQLIYIENVLGFLKEVD